MFPRVEKVTFMAVNKSGKPLGLKTGYKYGRVVFVRYDGQFDIYSYGPDGTWNEGA